MKPLKDIVIERLVLSKNTQRYTIDDITSKELSNLVRKYCESNGVQVMRMNDSMMDLHDIYGDDNKKLPYNKENGQSDMQIVYISGINDRHATESDDKYGLYLIGDKNQSMFRFGMSDLLDILGEDCLIEIYSFLKRKVEEL